MKDYCRVNPKQQAKRNTQFMKLWRWMADTLNQPGDPL